MKISGLKLLTWKNSATLSALCIFMAPAASQVPTGAAPAFTTKQFEVQMQAAEDRTRGQWVELASGAWAKRTYAAVISRDRETGMTLVHFRTDFIRASEDDGEVVVIATVWLDCEKGEQRVIARRGHDAAGKQLYFTALPNASAERIEGFYSGQEQQVCSMLYLLSSVPDGPAQFARLLNERMKERAARIPDRPVLVPPLVP